MDLSIIIVNWNSKDYLQKCIRSVIDSIHDIDYEIVVIDSGSFDGCDEMLRSNYPHVQFIQSEKNLGFARANNAAFLKSTGKAVLFLNPDTEVIDSAVNIMFDSLQRLSKVGAVGCKLLNADRTVQTSCIQSFPTILNQILDSEFLRKLWPKSSLWGNAPLAGTEHKPVAVEAISGACVMIKRSVFKQVGLFSEDYFMYTEDIDLCYKTRLAGYENYYIPDGGVIHFGGGSSQKKQSDFSVVIMRESIWRFLKKTRGHIYGVGYRAATLISAMGRMAILIIILPLNIVRQSNESWNASFRKSWAVMSWSLRIKNRLKNYYP